MLVEIIRNASGEDWVVAFSAEYRDGTAIDVTQLQALEFRVATLGRNGAEPVLVGYADKDRGFEPIASDDNNTGEITVTVARQIDPPAAGAELTYELWIRDKDGEPIQLEAGPFALRPSLKMQLGDLPA